MNRKGQKADIPVAMSTLHTQILVSKTSPHQKEAGLLREMDRVP